MQSAEKEMALKKEFAVILAAIDHQKEDAGKRLRLDGVQRAGTEYFQYLKQEVEACYNEGKLKRLQNILSSLKEEARFVADTRFGPNIKKKTGFIIDIFENLPQQVEKILQQGKIKTQNEYNDATAMINLWRQSPGDKTQMDRLNKLYNDYLDRIASRKPYGSDNIVVTTIWHRDVSVFDSPDNKRQLILAQTGAGISNPHTMVSIRFERKTAYPVMGTVYKVSGTDLQIKPYWKNNHTIVIETKKEYPVTTKHSQVESYDDLLKIEYIEN